MTEFNQTLVPAYGRDYKSYLAVLQDLVVGKDFLCELSGGYIAIGDMHRLGITKVWIRYNKLRMKAAFDVPSRRSRTARS